MYRDSYLESVFTAAFEGSSYIFQEQDLIASAIEADGAVLNKCTARSKKYAQLAGVAYKA